MRIFPILSLKWIRKQTLLCSSNGNCKSDRVTYFKSNGKRCYSAQVCFSHADGSMHIPRAGKMIAWCFIIFRNDWNRRDLTSRAILLCLIVFYFYYGPHLHYCKYIKPNNFLIYLFLKMELSSRSAIIANKIIYNYINKCIYKLVVP